MILSTGLEPHREDEEFLEEGDCVCLLPCQPFTTKDKSCCNLRVPTHMIHMDNIEYRWWWKKRITRNQDASCLVRNAEKCSHSEPLIKHHHSRAGRNFEMLSLTRGIKSHQLLTDSGLVLPWILSLTSLLFKLSSLCCLSRFLTAMPFWGTMISLFLSTFIYSSVSAPFLAYDQCQF